MNEYIIRTVNGHKYLISAETGNEAMNRVMKDFNILYDDILSCEEFEMVLTK